MKIMTVNVLNNSIEYVLFEMKDRSIIASGEINRIGLEDSEFIIKYSEGKISQIMEIVDYSSAIKILFERLVDLKIINSYEDIKAIGHRVLYGGTKYIDSVMITDKVINDISDMDEISTLYNKYSCCVMSAFKKEFPNILMVAVFDTAFHQTISMDNYLYSVPYQWYEKYGIRKHGFYGISHKYVTLKMSDVLGTDNFKLISCHLGNGGSISAIKDMKVADTSMGFTPLTGVMMGTRSGDIDPSIIPYVMEHEGKNASEVIEDLNENSGLLGISEFSSDMRDILSQCNEENEKALLAKNKFVRRVVDYIAEYYVLLGGADVIVFTAGIGENSVPVRREICEKLACLGVKIDLDLNNKRGEFVKISTDDSKIGVYVVPANEELMVAIDTLSFIENR